MKKIIAAMSLVLLASISFANDIATGFVKGNAEIQSINAIDFSPEGVLFIGDSQSGKVIAIKIDDAAAETHSIEIKYLDNLLSSLLGARIGDITINDMTVNPVSKKVYLAVSTVNGGNLLLKSTGKTFENVDLTDVMFSSTSLVDAIGVDSKDRRGNSMRKWAISDLQYYKGKVMVSGLSNAEFSSSLRSIDFPFNDKQHYSSLEIYHASHAQYETHSPIKTFMPYNIGGKDYAIASYTCTPLVLFPIDELTPGTHTKGKTVAELGNRNTPLDIISYKKGDKEYLLMANSSRALMKIDPEVIGAFPTSLSTPVQGSATSGIDFINMPYVNILQLDKMDDEHVVAIQRKANGDLDLITIESNRL
jgi:hypothetical protein